MLCSMSCSSKQNTPHESCHMSLFVSVNVIAPTFSKIAQRSSFSHFLIILMFPVLSTSKGITFPVDVEFELGIPGPTPVPITGPHPNTDGHRSPIMQAKRRVISQRLKYPSSILIKESSTVVQCVLFIHFIVSYFVEKNEGVLAFSNSRHQ
jgi:hypothetical protein